MYFYSIIPNLLNAFHMYMYTDHKWKLIIIIALSTNLTLYLHGVRSSTKLACIAICSLCLQLSLIYEGFIIQVRYFSMLCFTCNYHTIEMKATETTQNGKRYQTFVSCFKNFLEFSNFQKVLKDHEWKFLSFLSFIQPSSEYGVNWWLTW